MVDVLCGEPCVWGVLCAGLSSLQGVEVWRRGMQVVKRRVKEGAQGLDPMRPDNDGDNDVEIRMGTDTTRWPQLPQNSASSWCSGWSPGLKVRGLDFSSQTATFSSRKKICAFPF